MQDITFLLPEPKQPVETNPGLWLCSSPFNGDQYLLDRTRSRLLHDKGTNTIVLDGCWVGPNGQRHAQVAQSGPTNDTNIKNVVLAAALEAAGDDFYIGLALKPCENQAYIIDEPVGKILGYHYPALSDQMEEGEIIERPIDGGKDDFGITQWIYREYRIERINSCWLCVRQGITLVL